MVSARAPSGKRKECQPEQEMKIYLTYSGFSKARKVGYLG
jgi:hypothetical protein